MLAGMGHAWAFATSGEGITVPASTHYDVVIIGSGFGGSVAALRLTEKGYRVAVLEAGRRFADDDFPETSWDVKNFIWEPRLGLLGIQRLHFLPNLVVLAGAGVGGGSLNYANTLYEPTSKSDAFYRDPQWAAITDWNAELAPFYDQARRMLGVVPNPTMTPSDDVLLKAAKRLGVEDTFTAAPVGVFFGRDGQKEPEVEVDDPYFGGAGPRRVGCKECGECMTGCRYNSKNTLLKNYLYLAERAGATVYSLSTVERLQPRPEGGYRVDVVRTGPKASKQPRRTFTADQVILAAGTWGTQTLLHTMKADGVLPNLSDRLGVLTRTNSEALGGGLARKGDPTRHDYTQGVAITSSIHPDGQTHVEPVRYGKGSNLMALLFTVAADGDGTTPRWARWLGQLARHPGRAGSLYFGINDWSERMVIGLVMQTANNSITILPKRTRRGTITITSTQGQGEPNPSYIPIASRAYKAIAEEMGGFPLNTGGEMFEMPLTAHFIGGCVIGDSPDTGVIDAYHRVYNYPGLHVTDGSAISANLGVNPALTITAQAERAMSMWPNKGQPDPRPALGETYRPTAPVTPAQPTVPTDAPGALRLPIVDVR